MKKLLFLLSIAIIIAFSGCQKETLTCKIVSQYDGQSILFNKDVTVKIEATSNKSDPWIQVSFDEQLVFDLTAPPYIVTIPSQVLTIGKHTIHALASLKNKSVMSSVTVNVVESLGEEKESPDFVDFADGKFPTGWITYSWEIDDKIGYSNNYSLRCANYPIATVYTKKTVHVLSCVEFYTKGGVIDLYIDDEKAQALSSVLVENGWEQWIYSVDSGKHAFRWQAEGVFKYLDDIRFFSEE